jgi:trimeric autotransporter adhesin
MISTQTFVVPTGIFSTTGTKVEPDLTVRTSGMEVNQGLPYEYFNYYINMETANAITIDSSVNALITELDNVLSAASIAPNSAVHNQVLLAIEWLTQNNSGVTNLTNATASTAYNNGALIVSGGVGVAGAINVDNNVNALAFNADVTSSNVKVGYHALTALTTGVSNIAIGYNALAANTTGINNIAIGTSALLTEQTNTGSIAIGFEALKLNTTGANNLAIGTSTLKANTTGINNTAIGNNALTANTSGSNQTAIGYNALSTALGGAGDNSAFGSGALALCTGYENCAFGSSAAAATSGAHGIIAIGYQALLVNTTGNYNVSIGHSSMVDNTAGSNNVAIGWLTLGDNTTGVNNVAVGQGALRLNTTAYDNTAVGTESLAACTTGINNTALGYRALYTMTTGVNNSAIGANAAASTTTTSNEITLGDSSIGKLRCQVTTITALSDVRDKTDIEEVPIKALDFINGLKPVRYKWDKREYYKNFKSDGSKKEKEWQHGFIAQDLEELQLKFDAEWLRLVETQNPDKLEASPGKLLTVIIKAIQELSNSIDEIKGN